MSSGGSGCGTGKRFFAEGRNNANYELRQQQMQRAGNWRLGLRRQVLAQLANLGRDPQVFQGWRGMEQAVERGVTVLGKKVYPVADLALPVDEVVGKNKAFGFHAPLMDREESLLRLGNDVQMLNVRERASEGKWSIDRQFGFKDLYDSFGNSTSSTFPSVAQQLAAEIPPQSSAGASVNLGVEEERSRDEAKKKLDFAGEFDLQRQLSQESFSQLNLKSHTIRNSGPVLNKSPYVGRAGWAWRLWKE